MYDARSGVGDLGAGPRRHISLSQAATEHNTRPVKSKDRLIMVYQSPEMSRADILSTCRHRHVDHVDHVNHVDHINHVNHVPLWMI